MKKTIKLLISILTIFSLVCVPINSAADENNNITIGKAEVSYGGLCTIYAYCDNVIVDTPLIFTIAVHVGAWNGNLSDTEIIYVSQHESQNNSSILVSFKLDDSYASEELYVRIGNNINANAASVKLNWDSTKMYFDNILTNSVIYGNTIFNVSDINSITYERVVTAITTSENKIYFKLGDLWFDLLESGAKDATYLISGNEYSSNLLKNQTWAGYYIGDTFCTVSK